MKTTMMKTTKLALLLALTAVSVCQAAVISVENFGTATATGNFGTITTPTAGNYLIAAITTEYNGNPVTGMKFGGLDMTLLVSAASGSGFQNYVSLWGIATTSTSGALTATMPSTTGGVAYAFLSNVDTAAPVLATAADGAASGTTSTLNYSSDPGVGDFAFFGANLNRDPGSVTFSPADNQTSFKPGSATFAAGFGYDLSASGSDYTTTVTMSASDRYATAGVILNAVPEPSTVGLLFAGALGALIARRKRI